jgi:hypothetical protein
MVGNIFFRDKIPDAAAVSNGRQRFICRMNVCNIRHAGTSLPREKHVCYSLKSAMFKL